MLNANTTISKAMLQGLFLFISLNSCCNFISSGEKKAMQFYNENKSKDLSKFVNHKIVKREKSSYAVTIFCNQNDTNSIYFFFGDFSLDNPSKLYIISTEKEAELEKYAKIFQVSPDNAEKEVLKYGNNLIRGFEELGDLTEAIGHPSGNYVEFYQGIENIIFYIPENATVPETVKQKIKQAKQLVKGWYHYKNPYKDNLGLRPIRDFSYYPSVFNKEIKYETFFFKYMYFFICKMYNILFVSHVKKW